ncbi:uncharacterized protein BXZ73DRAFT_101864 [Epithele typhae]|uniref:uncharacterized protein n=1 Tax=Epithele typhae TaxID=378194 RepID=UPI0020075262|nr:uncharacterized protein BXZ73DRAFT_101864 [Epithele typhae]KAH9930493.1 hypothetical protein BXZ73DRAFT_101864 [Epithele typhae]
MADDEGERLDWGNDDDEGQHPPEHSGFADEDAEDAVSLGGDDEDEREFYATHAVEHPSTSHSKPSSAVAQPPRREPSRQSATLSRTPSRARASRSPTREPRPPTSAGKPSVVPPIIHALPAKPVFVPPLYENPSEPGILASAWIHRHKTNGSNSATPGLGAGDVLPPDWEPVLMKETGEVYYYNVKTQAKQWERPVFPPSGLSSPKKTRENAWRRALLLHGLLPATPVPFAIRCQYQA